MTKLIQPLHHLHVIELLIQPVLQGHDSHHKHTKQTQTVPIAAGTPALKSQSSHQRPAHQVDRSED